MAQRKDRPGTPPMQWGIEESLTPSTSVRHDGTLEELVDLVTEDREKQLILKLSLENAGIVINVGRIGQVVVDDETFGEHIAHLRARGVIVKEDGELVVSIAGIIAAVQEDIQSRHKGESLSQMCERGPDGSPNPGSWLYEAKGLSRLVESLMDRTSLAPDLKIMVQWSLWGFHGSLGVANLATVMNVDKSKVRDGIRQLKKIGLAPRGSGTASLSPTSVLRLFQTEPQDHPDQ